MATAAINGTLNSVLSGADVALNVKNATLNVNVDLPDTSTKDDAGWATHIAGQRDWSISISGVHTADATGLSPNEIMAAIIARSADTVIKFSTDGTGAAAGWTGNGTFQNMTITGDYEQAMEYSAEIVGNGALAAI